MTTKPNFGPNFGLFWPKFGRKKFFSWVLPLIYIRHCCKLSFCMQFQEKLVNQIWNNGKKPSFRSDSGPFDPNLAQQIFFFKKWLYQSLYTMVNYHHVQYQKNLMIQSSENLVTDGRSDGLTDWPEWFHRTLSS